MPSRNRNRCEPLTFNLKRNYLKGNSVEKVKAATSILCDAVGSDHDWSKHSIQICATHAYPFYARDGKIYYTSGRIETHKGEVDIDTFLLAYGQDKLTFEDRI